VLGPARSSPLTRYASAAALITLALLRDGSAQAPQIAYVQGNDVEPQTSQSVVTLAFTGAQSPGNLNLVAVGWRNTGTHIRSITDASGNSYTPAVGPTVRSGFGTLAI